MNIGLLIGCTIGILIGRLIYEGACALGKRARSRSFSPVVSEEDEKTACPPDSE